MRGMSVRLLLCLLLLTACAQVEPPEPEGPLSGARLVEALRDGGLVVYLRHTETTEGGTDDPTKPSDCAAQRKLSEKGKQDARLIGEAFQKLDLPVGEVIASPYCRTRETAELAFDEVRTDPAMLPLPGVGAPGQDAAFDAAKQLVAEEPEDGTLTVLVGHISVIEPVTGATPEEGGAAVFRPDGEGEFRIVAEVAPGGWQRLAEQG
jgi:phosphohistidine phosphatase SixA